MINFRGLYLLGTMMMVTLTSSSTSLNLEGSSPELPSLYVTNHERVQVAGHPTRLWVVEETKQEQLSVFEHDEQGLLTAIKADTQSVQQTKRLASLLEAKAQRDYLAYMSYHTDRLSIQLEEIQTGTQHYWVATIDVTDVSDIQTAFARSGYGYGFQKTSAIARDNEAVLAINASAFIPSLSIPCGPVIRKGIALNEVTEDLEPMVLTTSGQMYTPVGETQTSTLVSQGAYHTFRFGPGLIRDGAAIAIESKYKPRMGRNPRTIFAQISATRYLILIVDGRYAGASGMSLTEVQNLLLTYGVQEAYNLDGGGSTTLYWKGEVLNRPSDGAERSVADIIYFN